MCRKAVKRLARRGAKNSEQKEELSAFRDECADLDEEITENLADWVSVPPPPSPPSLSLFFYFLLYSQLFSHAVCRRMSTAMFCFRLAFCTELFHAFSLDYYDGNIAHTTEDSPIPVVRGNDKQLLTTELPSADWKCDRCVQ